MDNNGTFNLPNKPSAQFLQSGYLGIQIIGGSSEYVGHYVALQRKTESSSFNTWFQDSPTLWGTYNYHNDNKQSILGIDTTAWTSYPMLIKYI